MVTFLRSLLNVVFILIHFIPFSAPAILDDDDGSATESFEDDWHMDYMPTGYLPDSVYRELAWYGILQIQPLHHSSKYKVAAQLIWQHTLGRPHVIMESPPQSTQSEGKVSRQILAEEAAKWSREQRAAQEVLMENIKSGGNGLTVRTVISASKRTVYIIQNGNYYECPYGSEPDQQAYRVQANMHERKCTYGKSSYPIPIDPCIEAEIAPIEYSFHEGWMFCLGNGDRENNYFLNGTLDCGNKTKVPIDDFLEMCAIDQNVVITFDYFGDEPRKDMMHNATLCTTWDPCRLSYLYRLEPPPVDLTPIFPTTSPSPCDTTVCPECLEGNTESQGFLIDVDSENDDDIIRQVRLHLEDTQGRDFSPKTDKKSRDSDVEGGNKEKSDENAPDGKEDTTEGGEGDKGDDADKGGGADKGGDADNGGETDKGGEADKGGDAGIAADPDGLKVGFTSDVDYDSEGETRKRNKINRRRKSKQKRGRKG